MCFDPSRLYTTPSCRCNRTGLKRRCSASTQAAATFSSLSPSRRTSRRVPSTPSALGATTPTRGFLARFGETAETYARHTRQMQPEGPYAIAGYSLGSTLAFEVGKQLEEQGQEVRFLASIDYPGIHAKMLNREHMGDFARIFFKTAMKRRGV
jgi:thioesterase domain-containing protein